MTVPRVQKSNIGTIFRIRFLENGVARDISAATTMQIIFKKPDKTLLTKTATFTTNGTDGKIEYAVVAGDLDMIGPWEIQGYLVLPTWTGKSEVGKFEVLVNL